MKNKKVIIIIIALIAVIALGIFTCVKFSEKNLIQINRKELQEKIEDKDSFILVVSREGCSHCKEFLPIFEEILKDHDIKAYSVDLATLSKKDRSYLATIANVSGTPTTLFIENGEEKSVMNRIVGSSNRKNIESTLKRNGYIK